MNLNKLTADFLGVNETEDPRLLLGITKGRADKGAIRNALRRRLAQIHVHPEGFTENATKARAHLQRLARKLEESAPKEPAQSTQSQPELTPLDQSIIAALISEGGWNKNSRSRLVGVAASYSITVGGLMRILEAFAEAARSGRGPLSLQQRSTHTIDRSWASLPKRPTALSAVDAFITDAAKRFTPELSAPSPVMTIKLAVLFGLLTVIAFILTLRVLLVEESSSVQNNTTIKSSFPSTTPNVTITRPLKIFETYPTFTVSGIEKSMLQFADQGAEQPAILSSIAKSIQDSLTKGEVAPAHLLKDWNTAIDTLSYGWPFINSQILQSSQTQIIHILLQAELYPKFSKQLLSSFKLPAITVGSHNQISRIVWNSGVLATLSYEQRLNAETRNIAKGMQYPSVTTSDYSKAQSLALNRIADVLLKRTEFDNKSLEMWESWFIVVRQLHKFSKTNANHLYIINSILDSSIDLLRESNTRKVLGRAISDSDWLASSIARDNICSILRSEDASSIDLCVLTTLFHRGKNATWFPEKYIFNQNASFSDRVSTANLLQTEWPIDTSELIAVWNLSIPVGLDETLVQNWREATEIASRLPDDDLMRFVTLRILNEAAISIWKGRPDLASRAIEMAKRIEYDFTSQFHTPVTEPDDMFIKSYRDAGKDQYDQIDAIEALLNTSATDLGVRDADLLASIALTDRKSKIRRAATKTIIEQFNNGPNVAVAIVQYVSRAKTKEQVLAFVANLTNSILPEQDSINWESAARKALVQHALIAGNKALWELDEISNDISISLISEYLMLNPTALPLSKEVHALDALEMVVDSWRRILPPTYVKQPNIDFNPTGILQNYLLKQIEYFALLQGEEARWRSQQYPIDNVPLLLKQLKQKKTILEQVNTVELKISDFWLRLLEEVVIENARRFEE